MTSITDGERRVETVDGEPGETERFTSERGLFGGNVSQCVTLR